MTAGSGKVFISYRRQDTAWPARQLYEMLVAKFGSGTVFKDVDNIDPGDDFVERITEAVTDCDVLLALIGPQWLTITDAEGARRLDDPDDFVRLELTAALSRGVRVIPILVDGARMPRADELPPELAGLVRRQAVEINPVGFNTDRLMATLTAAIAGPTSTPATTPIAPDLPAAPPAEAPGAVEPAPAPVPVSPVGVSPTDATAAAPPAAHEPLSVSPAPPRRDRRLPILVGAVVLVLALAAGLLVWNPWGAGIVAGGIPTSTSDGTPRPTGETRQPTPSDSGPSATQTPKAPPADLPDPPILAHRGGLEKHQFETQQAMEAAALAGFAVETDVRYTKDGVAVLVHDERAMRGLDCGSKDIRVSQTTWSELRKTCRSKPTAVDPNTYEVPTLDGTLEAIAAANPDTWVFLEVKTDLSKARLRELLATPGEFGLAERTAFTSFERDRLAAIRKEDPDRRRVLFVSGKQVPVEEIADDDLWGVSIEIPIATPEYIKELQDAGLKVVVWVANDPEQWDDLAAMKPDLVMTGYPEKYQEWLADRQ